MWHRLHEPWEPAVFMYYRQIWVQQLSELHCRNENGADCGLLSSSRPTFDLGLSRVLLLLWSDGAVQHVSNKAQPSRHSYSRPTGGSLEAHTC